MTDKPAKTGMPERAGIGPVPIDKIIRDERVNTRPVDTAWVQGHIPEFNPLGLGVPAVSHRADGTYVVLNGQNRVALALACNYGGEIVCEIYEGLSLSVEADLFLLHNDSRAVRPGHRFKAKLTKKDPAALAIEETAQRAGWTIGVAKGNGVLTAVSTMERLWRDGLRHWPEDRPFALEYTLQTITKAWQHDPAAPDAAIIGGIGHLYVKWGPGVSPDHMAAQLALYERGPANLLIQAKALTTIRGGGTAHSVAELVTKEYNKGGPPRRLKPYR